MGADASHKQAFIGIDVAHAGHQGLIEQGIFDGAAGALQSLAQVVGIERVAEGFGPQTGEAGDHLLGWRAQGHKPELSKGAHIHKAQLMLLGEKANPGVRARRSLLALEPLKLAGHAQMHPQLTGWCAIAFKLGH